MAGLCIRKSITDKLKVAIKKGDINLEKIYQMTSDERNTIFSHYVGKEFASLVNAEYEKAQVTAEKLARADYVTQEGVKKGMTGEQARDAFTKKATGGEFGKKLLNDEQTKKFALSKVEGQIEKNKEQQKVLKEKIDNATGGAQKDLQFKLDKLKDKESLLNIRRENVRNPLRDRILEKLNSIKGIMGDEDYNDLVTAKMGYEVSPAEADYIAERTTKLQDLAKDNPVGSMTTEYKIERAKLDSFIDNLQPKSPISIIKNGINTMRNFLILSFKTPIKVLEGTGISHVAGMISRRIVSGRAIGEHSDLVKQLRKANDLDTKRTGIPNNQMTNMNDVGTFMGGHSGAGSEHANETFDSPHSDASTALGKVQGAAEGLEKITHHIAITLEHQKIFNWTTSHTFYDILNLGASDFAKLEGLKGQEALTRGEEIIRDANLIEPQTTAGKELRTMAQAGASRIVNTNDTYAARATVAVKNALNSINPDVPIGNLIEPMAKIPTNVVWNSMMNSPVGIPHAIFDLAKGLRDMTSESSNIETKYKALIQYQRGFNAGVAIFGSFAMSALITSQLKKDDFRSNQYGQHFMRFGSTWVNTEYLSRMNPWISGMMGLKMNPKENKIQAFLTGKNVGEGALGGLLELPGLNIGTDAGFAVLGKHPGKTILKSIQSRVEPAIAKDIFGKNQPYQLFFGTGVESDTNYKKAKNAPRGPSDTSDFF